MGDSEEQLPSDIFLELASDTRCEILKMLYDKPAHATKIANTLKLTKQETHRNTARLTEVGMIKKDVDGFFLLTEFGRAITSQFSYFQFLNKHKEFFEGHTFGNLPEKFVQRLGALGNTQLVSSVTVVLEKLKKMESSTKNQLKIMVSQGWHEEGKILADLAKKDVKILTIVGKNTIFPSELMESSTIKEIERLRLQRKNLEQRVVNKVEVGVYLTDESCAIMFPNRKGEINLNSMFVGHDSRVREWCNDVFGHYWKFSKPFTSFKDFAKNNPQSFL